jgi:delta1-piperideine-2-carboxylate reductase
VNFRAGSARAASDILINPEAGKCQSATFASRVDELIAQVKEAGQTRRPGDRRLAARESSIREGIFLTDEDVAMLESVTKIPE